MVQSILKLELIYFFIRFELLILVDNIYNK